MTVHAPAEQLATAPTNFSCPHTFAETYAAAHVEIKEAKYDYVSPSEVAKQCTHLSPDNQEKLT